MADQIWQFQAFPAPDGEAAAVKFLNEPLRQGRGEASATLRSDGTAGLLWLEPGSLGEGTEQTWQFQEFPAPGGEAAAVNFLNEPLRQGRGEASATLRSDGTAGLLWLEPGSLGEGTEQTWQFQEFPAPGGEAAAVNFLNEPARQGPGEATVTPRGNGTVGLLWLEPGSLGDATAPALAVQGLRRPRRRAGRAGVPERLPPAGDRGSQRVRADRRLGRDRLPRAGIRLIPLASGIGWRCPVRRWPVGAAPATGDQVVPVSVVCQSWAVLAG